MHDHVGISRNHHEINNQQSTINNQQGLLSLTVAYKTRLSFSSFPITFPLLFLFPPFGSLTSPPHSLYLPFDPLWSPTPLALPWTGLKVSLNPVGSYVSLLSGVVSMRPEWIHYGTGRGDAVWAVERMADIGACGSL